MPVLTLILATASIMAYLVSAGLFAYQLRNRTDRFQAIARVLFFCALLMHSVAIGVTSSETGGTMLQGPNILILAAWTIAVAFAFFEIITKKPYGYGAFVVLAVAVLMIAALFMNAFLGGSVFYNRVYAQWPVLAFHIVLFFLSVSAFLISAVASGMLLYQEHLVRIKSTRFLTMRMPALSTLRLVARRAVAIGMLLFTLGILIGVVRMLVLEGTMADMGCSGSLEYLLPRIVLSIVLWVAYCVYLTFIYLMPGRVPSRACSWISVIAGASSLVLLVLSAGSVI